MRFKKILNLFLIYRMYFFDQIKKFFCIIIFSNKMSFDSKFIYDGDLIFSNIFQLIS